MSGRCLAKRPAFSDFITSAHSYSEGGGFGGLGEREKGGIESRSTVYLVHNTLEYFAASQLQHPKKRANCVYSVFRSVNITP